LEYIIEDEEEEDIKEIKNILEEAMGPQELHRRETAVRRASLISLQEHQRVFKNEKKELEHLKVRSPQILNYILFKLLLHAIQFLLEKNSCKLKLKLL